MKKEKIYLNFGAVGKYSDEMIGAVNNLLQFEKKYGGAAIEMIEKREAILHDSRMKFSELLNCDFEEMCVTSNTTEGINIVAYGLDLKLDDEVIVTDEEHYSCMVPWENLVELRGVKVVNISLGNLSDASGNLIKEKFLQCIKASITSKTKAVFLSHVLWTTGIELPIEDVCKLVKSLNSDIVVIVDGAQTVGHIDVDVKRLQCGAYSFTGGKWLNAPTGTGGLYIDKQLMSRIKTVYCGWNSVNYDKNITFREDARRFEVSTRNVAILGGLNAAINIYRSKSLRSCKFDSVNLIKKHLIESGSYDVIAPENKNSIITFKHKNVRCEILHEQLLSEGILCKKVLEKNAIRLCIPVFNSDDLDLKRIYEALEKIEKINA